MTNDSQTAEREGHLAHADGAVLRADNLIAGYLPGVNILNGADLYCQPGELVGIIGPNGAGKSTLLKALFGLVKVHEGSVKLKGDDITNQRADQLVSKGIGFVPQNNNVFPSLTIEENLEMGCYQEPKRFNERFGFVTDLFPRLGERRKQRAGQLSGGERQMVAMGRALMMDPSVLLLDEPSAGLSPVLQDEVFVQTRNINTAGVSVIMVEQNARRCLQICDRGYVLDQGRNAYSGTGKDLADDPKVIELYLGTLGQEETAEPTPAAGTEASSADARRRTPGTLGAGRLCVCLSHLRAAPRTPQRPGQQRAPVPKHRGPADQLIVRSGWIRCAADVLHRRVLVLASYW